MLDIIRAENESVRRYQLVEIYKTMNLTLKFEIHSNLTFRLPFPRQSQFIVIILVLSLKSFGFGQNLTKLWIQGQNFMFRSNSVQVLVF